MNMTLFMAGSDWMTGNNRPLKLYAFMSCRLLFPKRIFEYTFYTHQDRVLDFLLRFTGRNEEQVLFCP